MFTWIVTGAAGHLGGTIIRLLEERKAEVRGLVLPHESVADEGRTRYFTGDVTRPETLVPLLEGTDPAHTVLIHTAGLIDIGDRPYEELRRVNVEGTRNVLALCRQYGVRRMVYVSSVHAIAQDPNGGVLREITFFSPDAVVGSYAKTKAEATRDVLDAAAAGLDAVVVRPSGILGPYDKSGSNHLVQVIRDFMTGKLPACVRGGYDMVDVRDVAWGCIAAALNGRKGECYILSNRRCDISDMLEMVRQTCGGHRLPVLPLWLARAAAPLLAAAARMRGRRPLYTAYSLQALASNDRFSHDKATAELGYHPRDLCLTVQDTVRWLQCHGVQPRSATRMRRRAKGASRRAVSADQG